MSIINMSSSCSSIDLGSSFTAFAVALAFGFLLAMGAPRPTRYKDLLRLHEQQDAGLHVLACAVMRMISCVAQDKKTGTGNCLRFSAPHLRKSAPLLRRFAPPAASAFLY